MFLYLFVYTAIKKLSFIHPPTPQGGMFLSFSHFRKTNPIKALFLSKTTSVMSILARAHYARKRGSNYHKFNVRYHKFNVAFRLNYHKFNVITHKSLFL